MACGSGAGWISVARYENPLCCLPDGSVIVELRKRPTGPGEFGNGGEGSAYSQD